MTIQNRLDKISKIIDVVKSVSKYSGIAIQNKEGVVFYQDDYGNNISGSEVDHNKIPDHVIVLPERDGFPSFGV